jgi:hypothetical protein|tara:strand:+ start:221 stop:679 length:459 start_codon:yes stop_codon:yes gene_type:complete
MQTQKIIKNEIEVLPIIPSKVEDIWDLVHFMIKEALVYSGGYAEPNDIKKLLLSGENQLFLVFGSEGEESNKVYGVVTTRIFNNPNFKELQGLICTGKKMNLWEEKLINTLETFAKVNGCKKVKAYMRPGYKKVMPKYGYKSRHVEFEKELN